MMRHEQERYKLFGIIITSNGPVGWIMGKDADIWLFKDRASATTELKKLKSSDAYTWHCEAVAAEFPGWGKK